MNGVNCSATEVCPCAVAPLSTSTATKQLDWSLSLTRSFLLVLNHLSQPETQLIASRPVSVPELVPNPSTSTPSLWSMLT